MVIDRPYSQTSKTLPRAGSREVPIQFIPGVREPDLSSAFSVVADKFAHFRPRLIAWPIFKPLRAACLPKMQDGNRASHGSIDCGTLKNGLLQSGGGSLCFR